jgi:ribosomal protein S18 acetylase RimI-like enzyme
MDEVVIRRATLADYEELSRLFKDLDDHHVELLPDLFQPFPAPPRTRERVQEFVEGDDSEYIVAEVAGKLVGFLSIREASHPPLPMFRPHDFALIDNIIVDQSFRGGSIGELLMAGAKEWTAEHGLKFIQANVYSKNNISLQFFRNQGFDSLSERFELSLEAGD